MLKKKVLNISVVTVAVLVVLSFSFFVDYSAAADKVAIMPTSGMTCGACADRITKELKGEHGVGSVSVLVEQGMVTVAFDSAKTMPEKLAQRITSLGYGSSVAEVVPMEEYIARSRAGDAPKLRKGCTCCG